MKRFEEAFVDQCLFRLNENLPRINGCLEKLSEKQVWQRPNTSSNSIGNLILHLSGNISQYAIASLGNLPDKRIRDAEFEATGGMKKKELYRLIADTIHEAELTIKALETESWLKERSVQGFNFTGIGILIHVVEHLSYHTGQIAFYTKLLLNEDLGFYADVDLNKTNENF